MPKTQQPPALHSAPVTLDGSQQQCPFFNATLSGVGECEAFPDSGSKVTLISKARVPESMIIPWTEPPLVVAGGSTVLPVGAAFLKISRQYPLAQPQELLKLLFWKIMYSPSL
ncbi:hypothetical protein HPB50_001016 [Hyalomma asiaticum]|uniref:Uncharacterized protein n=1 Tax=Hyalomma asiaticum TaxID=266040 RepID=A0ACB7RX69_HYAAI|nr:hypothetical protein HPB50_001016 [Hyalomma asiaticum]